MENYEVTIARASKELNAMERLALKDTTDSKSFDSAIPNGTEGKITIIPTMWVELNVHNPYSKDNPDYTKFVVVTKDGTKYTTGSKSFIDSFLNIWTELSAEGITEFNLNVFKVESKNYKGKAFITCALAL